MFKQRNDLDLADAVDLVGTQRLRFSRCKLILWALNDLDLAMQVDLVGTQRLRFSRCKLTLWALNDLDLADAS